MCVCHETRKMVGRNIRGEKIGTWKKRRRLSEVGRKAPSRGEEGRDGPGSSGEGKE